MKLCDSYLRQPAPLNTNSLDGLIDAMHIYYSNDVSTHDVIFLREIRYSILPTLSSLNGIGEVVDDRFP